ncbi:MAG: gliding motility-associated-like protein, partial [Planctomycetota bacterium]
FVCLGDSVQLNVNGASTYVWSPNTSLTDDTLSNPLSYSINDIQYFVTGIDVNGCSNIDSLDLTVSNVFASFDFPTACLGDAVFFTDLSSNVNGTTSLWSWNFNDPTSGLDSVSIIQNPSHVFNSSGNFDVVLSIENDKFCSADTLIQLNVNTAPEAIFVSDSVCLGLPVDFSSLLSTNGTGTIVQTHWDFGTGIVVDTSNITTPSFTFGAAGLYTVCLTVTSDLDCISNFDDTCMVVQIYNLPTTDENVDTVCLGNSNNFIDLTIAGDAPVIAEYWNFDQNINDTLLIIGNNGTTNFGYNTYGSYNVLHISIDANSCIDSSRVNVLVYDNPVSNFSFASNCINADNIFTSTSTNGLDGINTINQYSWDIDEGASFNLGADIETVDFNNLGMHNVSLIVTDNFGCTDTSTQNINILFAPIAQIILSDNDICIGETINLDGSSSNNSTPGVQYAWDDNYNSGIDNSLASYNISPMTDLQIMLVVTDDNNCVDTAFANMLTHENPVASFINDNGCINLPISLNSTSTSTDGIITNFDWLIDNVTTLTGENPAYIPLNNGTFNLQLIVESIHNCIDSSVIVSVTVDTTVVIDLLANDTVICAGTELPLEVIGTADNYLWLPANVFMDNTLESVIANIENTTNVSITGYSENDYCPEAIETLSVIVASAPSIDFTATPNPIFVGLTSEIELDVTPFNFKDSVIWDDNTSLNILEGLYVDATPEEETDYPFTVIYYFDSVRCTVDSFINIQVLDECNDEFIYAPNVFTPNNDAKNDVFGISGISVDHLNYLRIYDRWGKLMFEVENAEFKYGKMKKEDSWNGNSATGNYCNNGVYVIMYEAVCVNGSSVIGNGNVTLVR